MNQFLDQGFVDSHNLKFEDWEREDDLSGVSIPQLRLQGLIACRGKISITVDKYLDIIDGSGDDALIQTVSYAYNASVQGFGNILRYDNRDDYFVVHSAHKDKHHKHSFNWLTDTQNFEELTWVGYDNWPTLGQVIEELQDWYWSNYANLATHIGDPNTFAVLNPIRKSSR